MNHITYFCAVQPAPNRLPAGPRWLILSGLPEHAPFLPFVPKMKQKTKVGLSVDYVTLNDMLNCLKALSFQPTMQSTMSQTDVVKFIDAAHSFLNLFLLPPRSQNGWTTLIYSM